jgi:hypothetical protein
LSGKKCAKKEEDKVQCQIYYLKVVVVVVVVVVAPFNN